MSYLRSNRLQLGAVIVLAGLLFTLAVFQYNWLGRLAEREQDQMRRTLNWATRTARSEFDSELADLYKLFQVDFREDATLEEQIAARWFERVDTVEGPEILDGIYWVQLDETSGLVLKQFTGLGLAVLDEWPAELRHLKHEFADQLRYNDVQFELPVGPAPLQDDIPALVIQQVFSRPWATRTEYKSISWIIATLRRDVIFDELIPALSNEYIAGEGGFVYDVGVTKADDPSVLVYSSDPTLSAESFAEADALHSMYALRIWHFNQRVGANRRIWGVVEETVEPRWNLAVRHQSGSLAAAVAAARNRSLAISLGVLLLLGVAVAMIVVSTRRAQTLAAQQMEFVAGVSHELRTPLAVIRAAGENLADAVVQDPDRTRQYGEVINREGRRLSDMVERVLLFAKMRSGNAHFEQVEVDLRRTIEDAVASNSARTEERSVQVTMELPEALPAVFGDRAALTSVMENLISNAVKYSRHGGIVTVQARAVGTAGDAAVQIGIHDQGDGIPSSELPHLFDPFFRGDRARAAQIEGSGLGLSLVKQVVDAHGGHVEAVSTPGAGSTFLVQLPAVAEAVS